MSGGYVQVGSVGRGFGETSKGNFVQFEFFSEKSSMIAKFEEFKDLQHFMQIARMK